ncbi:MAG: sulfurtransferase [Propionibacteriaceae bacterium]|nr:sulfurtransferase [Propionibacteriaceae bacterium]
MIPPVVPATFLSDHPEAVLADVRYTLADGPQPDAYANGHLPGAVFVDLNAALAAPATPDTGRHPLPEPTEFAEQMSALGIGDDSVVIAYDDGTGAWAGRLVWLLRMLGVDAALLDGGLAAWEGPLETGAPTRASATFTARPWDPAALATIDDAATAPVVVDARAAERYRGESEPIDPRAGHIPGAINIPFAGNLADGRFRTPDALRARFAEHGITDATGVVVYCGSGVTACHNLIALEYAGLGRAQLYPGSWSQWASTDRPAATGEEPGSKPSIDPSGRISG